MSTGLAFDRERFVDWAHRNPGAAQTMLEAYRRARLQRCREDINEFIEYVGRDEETGAPLRQAPIHQAFQGLAEEHPNLVLWSHIESGKTSQLSVLRPLWLLGRNPNLRIGIVSNTVSQAKKIIAAIQSYIERSEQLREVFPELQQGPKWSEQALTVKRSSHAKDYSIQALGVHGAVLGARLDVVVLDDILDYENTRTPAQREDLAKWLSATIFGRLTREGRILVVGTAWHPDDILHRLGKTPGWKAFRFPVLEPGTNKPRWSERWPVDRIRKVAIRLGALEAARQLHCRARDDEEARFKREWIDRCLARGEGRQLAYALAAVPMGYRVYTGVDLGTSPNKKSDLTSMFTICVHPNEDREVLAIESGRWTGPDIVKRVIDVHKRYGGIVLVESNAAQKFIKQFTNDQSAVPVLPFHTGNNKHHPEFGIESLAVELENAKWIIPNTQGRSSPEVEAFISEMLFYSPDAHTGDRLMAAWFAREGAAGRIGKVKRIQVGRVDLHRR